MDVKAGLDGVLALGQGLEGLMPSQSSMLFLAIGLIATALLFYSRIGKRLREAVTEASFSNWRLALLGTTGIVLSIASGWTTWDGMRNFTQEPLLSLLVTFGIQGVMLIVAWLIGESFAVGMSQRAADGTVRRDSSAWLGLLVGLLLTIAMFYAFLRWNDATIDPLDWSRNSATTLTRFADVSLYFAFGLLLVALFVINRRGDLALPYVQSARILAKNAILWVMFLACMTTSVFFSFDSLFSAIFPKDERRRAAEIRAVNQVGAAVSDIGARIGARQVEEADRFFKSQAWAGYEARLDQVAALASEAPQLIREQIGRELEAQKQRVAELEERRANAQGSQAGLATRKTALTEELSRLTGERPEAAASTQQQKAVVSEVEKRLDEARALTLAEEKGVEGSGKVGRGQFWRQAKANEERIIAELQVARERLRGHETRLSGIDKRLATIKAELAQIDGDLAKLKGEAETAKQMITVATSAAAGSQAQTFDPAAGLSGLEQARQEFRQKPQVEALARIQSQCVQLVSASGKVATLRDRAAALDCDPRQATEAVAPVFALNTGVKAFAQACAGGDRLPQTGGIDALIGFGRRCLQDSGLPSRDSAEFAARFSRLDLDRDDKAHRFVVTWNAFLDGNKLAYLALAIAIAIDSLVFMSGLFGANAVRSPLSDVPSNKARSAKQLEAIIDTALLPHRLDTARLVLGAMRPMTPRDGFMARIWVDDNDPHAADLLRVLSASATIGAVREGPVADYGQVYEVRSELFEYLSVVAKKEYEARKDQVALAELERTVGVALLPDIGRNAEMVLSFMHPMREDRGFMAEIDLGEVRAHDAEHGLGDARIVRSALNAGATLDRVQRMGSDTDKFFIHGDFYKTLSRIRGRLMSSTAMSPAAPRLGGSLQAGGGSLGAAGRQQIGYEGRAPAVAVPPPLPVATPDQHEPRQQGDAARQPSGPPAAAQAAFDSHNWILDELLAAAHLHAHDLEAAITNPAGGDAATDLLGRLTSDETLGQDLYSVLNAWDADVHRRFHEICGQQPGHTPAAREELSRVLDNLPMMMITSGRYQRFVNEIVKEAEDRIRPMPLASHNRLKAHALELADARKHADPIAATLEAIESYLGGDTGNVHPFPRVAGRPVST